jgi:hypothetical protein
MVINDSATVGGGVPTFLLEDGIAALEPYYGVEIVPQEPVHPCEAAFD